MAYTPTSPKPISEGIDVSAHNGVIDWAKVKAAGVKFAILRAGYGDALSFPGQIDKTFEYNYAECKKHGIPVGAYWYSYATTVEAAIQEAKSCDMVCKGKQFELPVLYDVEETRIFNSGRTNEVIKAWSDYMESLDYFVGVYIYRAALQSYLSERTRTRYAMAVAEYGPQLNYGGAVGFWQNSSTYRYSGIGTNVDHDYMYVDYPSIIKSKGKNGYKKTSTVKSAPAPTPSTPVTKKKSNEEIANEVIDGKWDSGDIRRKMLTDAGYDYTAVQAIVNKKMSSTKDKTKSIDEIAKEVIRGEWGAGITRQKRLTSAGYNYDAVQKKVDEIMSKY